MKLQQAFKSPVLTSKISAFTLLAALCVTSSCQGQSANSRAKICPDTTWYRYVSPEQAGWSSEKLAEIRAFADSLGSDAVMLIYDGAVVAAWGDTDGLAPIASVRKSLLNALYGIAVVEGEIDTLATLAELGIDDEPPLTEVEKRAHVIDLLSSSSGVYHKAAAETPGLRKPERGSVAPGEQWYYNNWDFNVLGTIYEQNTSMSVFEAFEKLIAEPIGMEDYRSGWGHYFAQPWRSIHPAYSIWMSARDLARFGLLYLRNGRWEGEQVVPSKWIAISTRPRWKNVYGEDFPLHYGLLWWIRGGEFGQYDTYFASGVGNQSVWILPELEIVFVHRASADFGQGVSGLQVEEILLRLIEAQTQTPAAQSELVPLRPTDE